MTAPCPSVSVDDIAGALNAVDCRLGSLVEGGYAYLLGPGGAFQSVLTVSLTIYVAIIAYGLLFGRLSLSIAALAPKLITIGLVLTFATSWPAYQRVVSDLLVRGPDQIVSAYSGQASGGGAAFAKRLDVTLARIEEAAAAIDPGAPADAQDVAALGKPAARSAGLIRTSGFLLTLGTLGVLVIARILLTALLAVGPIFVLLALFPATRGLFEGWLRTTLMFALSPLVAILAGSLGLMMVDPLIASILQDPGSAAADMKAAGALILAAIIDFALMLAGMAAAAGLARGWRLPRGESAAAMKGGERLGNASPAVQTASETVQAQAMGDRLGAIISAVLREAPPATGSSSRAAPAPVRVDVVSAAGAGPARNDRRAGGLIRNQRGVQSSNSAQRQLR